MNMNDFLKEIEPKVSNIDNLEVGNTSSDGNYYERKAFSRSDIYRRIKQGTYKYMYNKFLIGDNLIEPSKVMKQGTLVHCAVLEPHLLDQNYKVFTGKYPSSANMTSFCEQVSCGEDLIESYASSYSTRGLTKDKILLKAQELYEEMYSYITSMGDKRELITKQDYEMAVKVSEVAKIGIYNIHNYYKDTSDINYSKLQIEQELYFDINYQDTKFSFKAKPDIYFRGSNNRNIIIDLKTTQDANFEVFKHKIRDMNYVEQLLFYSVAIAKVTGVVITDFYIIAVELEEPYNMQVFQINFSNKNESLVNIDMDIMNFMDDLYANNVRNNELLGGNINRNSNVIEYVY